MLKLERIKDMHMQISKVIDWILPGVFLAGWSTPPCF